MNVQDSQSYQIKRALLGREVVEQGENLPTEGMQARFLQIAMALLLLFMILSILAITVSERDVVYWKNRFTQMESSESAELYARLEESVIDLQKQRIILELERIENETRDRLQIGLFVPEIKSDKDKSRFDIREILKKGEIEKNFHSEKFGELCSISREIYYNYGTVSSLPLSKKWQEEVSNRLNLQKVERKVNLDKVDRYLDSDMAIFLQKEASGRTNGLLREIVTLQESLQKVLYQYLIKNLNLVNDTSLSKDLSAFLEAKEELGEKMDLDIYIAFAQKIDTSVNQYVEQYFEERDIPLLTGEIKYETLE